MYYSLFTALLSSPFYAKLTLLEKNRLTQLYNEPKTGICSFFNNGTKKEKI